MKIINILNVWDGINRIVNSAKKWFFDHYDNPLMWLGLVVLGYIVFQVTYKALQKEK